MSLQLHTQQVYTLSRLLANTTQPRVQRANTGGSQDRMRKRNPRIAAVFDCKNSGWRHILLLLSFVCVFYSVNELLTFSTNCSTIDIGDQSKKSELQVWLHTAELSSVPCFVTALLFSAFHVTIHKILESIKRTFRINTFLRFFQSEVINSSEASPLKVSRLSRARLAIYITSANVTVHGLRYCTINTGPHLALSTPKKNFFLWHIKVLPYRTATIP